MEVKSKRKFRSQTLNFPLTQKVMV